ncbi:MAG: FtsW/RodA/SpoVE family cell cycle protein [Clostridia bacterium]|nr:FtsW/RodA/SpoVE family cell cycle protein [Clostridia bacterium]
MVKRLTDYIKKQGGIFAKGGIDVMFFAFLMLIVVVGLVMLYSASYVYAYYKYEDSSYFFVKQLRNTLIGFVLMLVFSKLNYKLFTDIGAIGGTLLSWMLLMLALIMPAHNGTHRHIYIGGFQFQPSDVAKFALILTLAAILSKYHNVIVSKKPLQAPLAQRLNSTLGRPFFNDSLKIIVPCFGIIGIYCVLVLAGSHLSGTILMLSIGLILMFLGEVRGKWFVGGGAAAAAVLFIASQTNLLKDYMEERITSWLDKDFDPLGARWQINQALYAIGSGGLFGKGLGQSTLKHLYVSEPQNDMIFSIVVEELGLVGAALIIVIFALLIWRGVVIGVNCPDRYGALVAMGVVFQVGVQVILNILVATDSVPNTGISLPFFSYGGTAIIVLLAQMGFVLSISRSSRIRR